LFSCKLAESVLTEFFFVCPHPTIVTASIPNAKHLIIFFIYPPFALYTVKSLPFLLSHLILLSARKIYFITIPLQDFHPLETCATRRTKKVLKISNNDTKSKNHSTGRTVSEAEEPIIKPEEFSLLPKDHSVIVLKEGHFIKGTTCYYKD
jgi:hypothetical protein